MHHTQRLHITNKRILFLSSLILLVFEAASYGVTVQFDFLDLVECQNVTSQAYASLHPDDKIIELSLQISVRFNGPKKHTVQALNFEIVNRSEVMLVETILPKTALHTNNLVEIITETNVVEKSNALEATLGGKIPLDLTGVTATLTPSASAQQRKREVTTTKRQKLPPRSVLLVSGTLERGHGVFFRLERSPQTTLEGVHTLRIRYVVPKNWRAGRLSVRCWADGTKKKLWYEEPRVLGRYEGDLEIHLAGDRRARLAAKKRLSDKSSRGQTRYRVAKPVIKREHPVDSQEGFGKVNSRPLKKELPSFKKRLSFEQEVKQIFSIGS